MRKNLKTTIFGLLAAVGGFFASNSTGKLQGAGQIVATLSTFLFKIKNNDKKRKSRFRVVGNGINYNYVKKKNRNCIK